MNLPSNPGAVVIDANILVSISSKEPTYTTAEKALAEYALKNWAFYAPGVIVGECLYALCQKLQGGVITDAKYKTAIVILKGHVAAILPPPSGEASLIERATEIQRGYGCSRSADGLYIALAEELAKNGEAEFLTFDKAAVNQAATHAPTVKVSLLPS
jgi:predicted nucleic acid-binding protein